MTLAIVVIGRNEGERLAACLDSVRATGFPAVYVDSGSTDNSLAIATIRGIPIVRLDATRPFTAARARNAGFSALDARLPRLAMVQFIDGDCTLAPDWLDMARAHLDAASGVAVVCGRRREREPDASVYNRLCDREWDTPIGIAETCGGDALIRADAFRAVGGFAPELIAGEEPELCWRIRDAGWLIRRIDCDMTVHDAAMTRPSQWWQRNRRSGFAFAEALARQGARDRKTLRRVVSNIAWGLPITWPLWPILWLRVFPRQGAAYATSITLGKIPHLHGQIDFWVGKNRTLIEYKRPTQRNS